ncbi:Hypothetical_protein [Hexamita inflata]|uniref:Hypothetical_protein n=1 Tax=Hexamita inflata TaxID=28002 RepID=A0AA86NAC6_9EUKA|nr:Hypothetical protein HINF_LOCUS3403 [Hexamita inflata]
MFIITQNNFGLQLNWSDDQNADPIDYQLLHSNYEYIDVYGTNSNTFNEYELISRSESLAFNNCKVDLNQLVHNFELLSLEYCECKNLFNNISVQSLILKDCVITIDQIKELNLDSLDVTVCNIKDFDFYSCHQLNCELSNLYLYEQDVDLAQLNGEWYYVLFDNCIFSNQINEDSFKTKCVEIKQASDTVSSDFLVPFEHLHCDELFIYIQTSLQTIPILFWSWLTSQQQLRTWKPLSTRCAQI